MNAVGPPVDLATLALDFAEREVGVQEEPRGSNSGPRVNQYQAVCHAHGGDAWCGCFACWCIDQAAHSLVIKPTFQYSAGALHLLDINPTLILSGPIDNCVVVWRHDNGKGHVALVKTVSGPNLHTIEGNTDANGGREGYEVAKRVRSVSDPKIAGYLKIA